MKRIFLTICLVCFAMLVLAQRKTIDQAQTFIKSGKNLDRAEKLMTDLLKDSVNRQNKKVWTTLIDAVKMQYDQGNQKLYLKQKYDTAALFNNANKLLGFCLQFDSIEAIPNKKGKVNIRYRDKHAEMLNAVRPNIYNGASFYLRKQDFKNAWGFYEAYIECANNPMFANYNYLETDTLMGKAAYRALYCAYRMGSLERTLKYQKLAERDSSYIENIIQYVAERQIQNQDTIAYVNALKRGFSISPQNTFFFPRLVDYYNMKEENDSAWIFIENALANDSANVLAVFAKSSALLNARQYDECINVTGKLIALNDSMPEAYCNMGLAYYNQALMLEEKQMKEKKRTKKQKAVVNALFEKSLPYMEKFRQMAPEQQAKWLPALYTIYFNLNMGKEFDEIEQLRK